MADILSLFISKNAGWAAVLHRYHDTSIDLSGEWKNRKLKKFPFLNLI